MARSGVTALSFAVLLAVFEIGSGLRCFQCNSQSNRECLDPFQTSQTVECNSQALLDFNRNYLRDVLPQRLLDSIAGAPKYCAKIVLQGGTTVRTCLDVNPYEPNQTCRDLERGSSDFSGSHHQLIQHCSICEKEMCNGAGSITASVPIALLALVASYLYYKQ